MVYWKRKTVGRGSPEPLGPDRSKQLRDFSILNHRNEEEEVRRSLYLEGPPYQSGGVLRVLLGAVGVCMTGFFPSSRVEGPCLPDQCSVPRHTCSCTVC